MTKSTPEPTRAYHLTSAEYAIDSIVKCRLKVARFSEANDPFELAALNCLNKQHRKALKGFKAAQDGKLGMLCFSQRWKNPVLWSHYADRHKGVCLGFVLEPTLGIRGVETVKYEARKLKLKEDLDSTESLPLDIQERLLVTKFEHWRYEEELRVFVELSKAKKEGDLYFYPFDQSLRLDAVILGPCCPKSRLETTKALVREIHPGVLVSRARLGFRSFEVNPDGRYPPQ